CTRTDTLPAGMSYPPITLTAGVATNAPSMVTNTVMASGGGATNTATASDPTTITSAGAPALSINTTPSAPSFPPGSSDSYSVIVSNSGTAATTGSITVMVTLDSNQILGSMGLSGTGSSCNNTMLTCTFSGTLAPGGSFSIAVPV